MENGAKWGVEEEEEEAGVSSTLGGKEGCGSGRRKEKGREPTPCFLPAQTQRSMEAALRGYYTQYSTVQ
jgi:hypothetical protein